MTYMWAVDDYAESPTTMRKPMHHITAFYQYGFQLNRAKNILHLEIIGMLEE